MDRPIIGRDRGSELTTAALYRQGCLKPNFDFMPFTIRAICRGRYGAPVFAVGPRLSPNRKAVAARPSLQPCRLRTSDRNSSRVCLLLRNSPSIALVTACPCCFSTPRICMHRCRASMITPTP
jgi:hypothetical protein